MIIDNPATILCPVEHAMGADLVYKPGRTAGKPKDFVNSVVREDIMVGTGVSKVSFYIFANMGTVQVWQFANSLPDGRRRPEAETSPRAQLWPTRISAMGLWALQQFTDRQFCQPLDLLAWLQHPTRDFYRRVFNVFELLLLKDILIF